MKATALLLCLVGTIYGQTNGRVHLLPGPTLAREGRAVDVSLPSFGAPVTALAGWTYIVAFEDSFGGGDSDYNDSAYRVDCEAQDDGSVLVTVARIGGITAYSESLDTPTQLVAEEGAEIILGLLVEETGDTFYTGDPTRNLDGLPHAWVIGAER